jgi:DNA-binding MarR family transcriptional regulator
MTAVVSAPDEVRAVADSLVSLVRSFQRARARLKDDVEWSSQVLLRHLAAGPMRAATLAETAQLDPSTVSRQVAALLKQGLLERTADPDDGRAALLTLTARARDVLAERDRWRLDQFARMLAGWQDSEVRQFAELFARFVGDFDQATCAWLAARPSAEAPAADRRLPAAPSAPTPTSASSSNISGTSA